MARNFADHFLVPLMIEVIRLAILHVKQPEFIEVGGAPLQCDVTKWSDRKTCSVSQHLGYGEKDTAAAELMQGYQGMAQDPAIAHMFGPPQRYEMLKDIAKLKGFNRFAAYLDPNAQPPQPQPEDPAKMIAAQASMTSAQASLAKEEVEKFKEQRLASHEQEMTELSRQELMLKGIEHARTHDRQDADTAHKIVHDEEQLQLDKALAVMEANEKAEDRAHTSFEKSEDRKAKPKTNV
jgi:hypothetical protein